MTRLYAACTGRRFAYGLVSNGVYYYIAQSKRQLPPSLFNTMFLNSDMRWDLYLSDETGSKLRELEPALSRWMALLETFNDYEVIAPMFGLKDKP